MYEDEEMPDTQPITQSTDGEMTQDFDNSPKGPPSWGRLCPHNSAYPPIELIKDSYTFGRNASCDICVMEFKPKNIILTCISKDHFRVVKETIKGSNALENIPVACIEDLSQNGTFLNKEKIGRGNRRPLQNNDEIAIASSQYKVYTYMDKKNFDGKDLPLEVSTKYAVSKKLGSGACGEVKLAFSKGNYNAFAMKIIHKTTISMGYSMADNKKILNEVEILRRLRHPCIIRTEEYLNTPHTLFIVLELMEGGELFDKIRKSESGLSDKQSKFVFYQVALAVQYLHSEGVTHRDLKPENILLATTKDETLVKITDFGLSKFVATESTLRTFCGTMMYVAPEILLTHGKGTYTNKVDVWSLGVILYTCLSALTPFNNNNPKITLSEQITQGQYAFPPGRFANADVSSIELIKAMMTKDPNERFSIDQVLKHKWLNDAHARTRILNLFKGCDDSQNWSPYLEYQINNMRLPPPRPVGHLAKRPRLEIMDQRL